MSDPCVLSIQSHVVHGYVGNKSATFPLQVLGFEVDAINSVQLSNHTGYGTKKGQVLNEKDLSDLAEGLQENNIDHYSHLLTGYVGNPTFLRRIGQLLKHLKTVNPDIIYVCDPVMGDNGRMYVHESLLPIYKEEIIPLASIITPNQFELELLTDKKVTSIEDAWLAVDELHKKGVPTVIVSSTNMGSKEELISLASTIKDGKKQRVLAKIPLLDAVFTGTGDLFAALLLAWMHLTSGNLIKALNNTLSSVQAVLKRTLQQAKSVCGDRKLKVVDVELRLIQSKKDIEHPSHSVHCELVS